MRTKAVVPILAPEKFPEVRRRGDWMQTFTGGVFWPLDPREDEVRIEDIAHALSLVCRFAGHCRTFYSVAEHSVRVSDACSPVARPAALLHDAAEAYVGDMVRPLKTQGEMAVFDRTERRIRNVIFTRFLGKYPIAEWDEIKAADLKLLATEARDLMVWPPPREWGALPPPQAHTILPWTAECAEEQFLMRFTALFPEVTP